MSEGHQNNSEARKVNLVAGLVLAAISLSCLFWLIPTHVSSQTTPGDLPPTMMPYLSATAVLILATGLLLQTLLVGTGDSAPISGRLILFEMFLAAAVTVLILAANQHLGFLAMSIALTGSGMVFAGGRRWIVIGSFSIGFPVLIWLGAWHIFSVQLP